MSSKILISDISKILKDRNGAFLCCASFEKRSLSIPAKINTLQFKKVLIFASEDRCPYISETASEINNIFLNKTQIVNTRMRDPLSTADSIAKAVQQLIAKNIKDVIIDISTFTHEMLLILIMILWRNKDHFSKVTCIYTGARDYSLGDSVENKWLSKGCKEVRSVFGFPGQIIPGRPSCLIVLVGFEHERATRMITTMEPELLLLGRGLPSSEHLTHDSHKAPMEYFHKLVEDMGSSRGDLKTFEFSCRDANETIQLLQRQIEDTPEYNHIVVPLNTKISTVAVGLVALQDTSLQVCYAEPETYNFAAYSEPDNKVTIFDIW
ncbi:hypothetical protein [Dethiobacter alkaliphilus]|uniref:hypothetical protein n=1 Tax=Dethiobacter alkaliphilus TaxID=427926 RepID=UPI002226CE4E|nr:hypothetical protein [Dethiobacter alkaliphilus]MCW3490230.1 hypothetical protein [Dethiobacter alkaliphilus]